jgi:hypothetical protein
MCQHARAFGNSHEGRNSLLLDLVELLDLVRELVDGILLLLLQDDGVLFVLDLGLLEVTAQLLQLGLALLVEVNLEAKPS